MDTKDKFDLALRAAVSYKRKFAKPGEKGTELMKRDSKYNDLWLRVRALRQELGIPVEKIEEMFSEYSLRISNRVLEGASSRSGYEFSANG